MSSNLFVSRQRSVNRDWEKKQWITENMNRKQSAVSVS